MFTVGHLGFLMIDFLSIVNVVVRTKIATSSIIEALRDQMDMSITYGLSHYEKKN